MKTEHFVVSTLDFFRVFFVKNFFPKFELLNSGCGLSASAAYLRVFTVLSQVYWVVLIRNGRVFQWFA